MTGDILRKVRHRPWPLPAGPWIMAQSWHDLLFAHWPIPEAEMRDRVPRQLELDTFDGWAWVGVVPFRMSGVRPRWMPSLPWLSAFPELNVRTYVTGPAGGETRPGVYFFSLEAANPVAVRAARNLFKLPYFDARMSLIETEHAIRYRSRRTHRGAPPADFAATYRPISHRYRSTPDSLDHWLTERYCLYTLDRAGRVLRGEIHHEPWPLQLAEAAIATNTMAAASGIELPSMMPLLHFARRLDVVVWPLRRVT